MAKKTGRREPGAVRLRQELKYPWLVPVMGLLYFVVTCMMLHGQNKVVTLLLMVAALIAVALYSGKLGERMTWPALMLALYVCMDGVSTLYAPSGKFALYEFLKVIGAACMALLLTVCEPEREGATGRCAATVLEVSAALAAFFSIDMVSTRIFYRGLYALINGLGVPFGGFDAWQEQRLRTIFENPNIFGGCAGVGILLSLGLAASASKRKERCLHLVCLLFSCTAFLLAMSRGAIAAIAVAFLLFLLMERGSQRAVSFVLMVETLVLTLAASLAALTAYGVGNASADSAKGTVIPLLALIVCAGALCALDLYAGRPLAEQMARHMKKVNLGLLGVLALLIALLAVAVSWTGPVSMKAGQSITRGAYLGEGSYTLHVEADGPVEVTVQTQTREDAVMNTKQTAYTGAADGAAFIAPEGTQAVTFVIRCEADVHITAVRYSGAEEGALKLNYRLLPEAIAGRIQNLRTEGNVVQRLVYCADGLKLYRRSPIVGVGMGAFENGLYSVQTYHYQAKQVHNHYVQSLLETGVIGLALWLGLLAANIVAVVRLWRKGKEEPQPMAAALGALLVFMMIHAAVEVDFSSGYFLCFGYGAFAVVNLTCGGLTPLPFGGERCRKWIVRGEGLAILAFTVLLSMNLVAQGLAQQRTFDKLAQAADLDPYEWADYKLSYVYSAADNTERTEDMTARMERYMADLEALRSNSVPQYLAEVYFKLGNVSKGFAMLEKYVDYTPSNPDTWAESFQTAMDYDDGSDTFRQGVLALKERLDQWNRENLGTITLPEDIAAYVAGGAQE